MKKIELTHTFQSFEAIENLPEHIQNLMEAARESRKNAYAPYSHFLVGAAILLDNNQIVLGNNQENAAYPSGLCAERTAVFACGANYPNQKITAIAISASPEEKISRTPVAPCGACRQSLLEYEVRQNSDIPIYFMGAEGPIIQSESIKDLLPFTFDPSFL